MDAHARSFITIVLDGDVLRCAERGGSMRIIAEIHPPDTTRVILEYRLEYLGLPTRVPPLAPPGPGPDAEADRSVFDPI